MLHTPALSITWEHPAPIPELPWVLLPGLDGACALILTKMIKPTTKAGKGLNPAASCASLVPPSPFKSFQPTFFYL